MDESHPTISEGIYPAVSELDKKVREVVTKKLLAVPNGASLQEAAEKINEFSISSLVVVEPTEKKDNGDELVIGILTEEDITEAVAKGKGPDSPVEKIMKTCVISVDINTSVEEVLELMFKEKIKHVLVTEEGESAGIISWRDLEDTAWHRLETYVSRE